MNDNVVWTCFKCGEAGHVKAECPHPAARRHPPAPGLTAGPDRGTPIPPPVPPRRPAEQIADPEPWADQIREAMGWSRGAGDEQHRAAAMEHVSESRTRAALLDDRFRPAGMAAMPAPAEALPRWTRLIGDQPELVAWLAEQEDG